MKIAIVGGGITGLSIAYNLSKQGISVDLYEKEKQLGGLLRTFDINETPLENYYHHFFNTDTHLINMIKELGLSDKIVSRSTKVAFFHNNKLHPFTKPIDLLKFSPLSLMERLKLGMSIKYLSLVKDWKKLEEISAKKWIIKFSSKNVYKIIWEPLLKIKFGDSYDKISAAWIWGRINARMNSRKKGKEELLYLKGSFKLLVNALEKNILRNNGKIIHKNVIKIDKNKIFNIRYDKIILTTPNPIASTIADWPDNYKEKLQAIRYQSIVCMAIVLKKQLSDLYWINVTDSSIPFGAVIEHTNLMERKNYDSNIIYLMNYISSENPLYKKNAKQIFQHYEDGLKKLYPNYKKDLVINYSVYKDRYATPIYSGRYSKNMVPFNTPLKDVYLVNTSQIYPHDRNVNFSIALAQRAEKCILD